MKPQNHIAAALVLLLACTAAQAVNKCTVNGKIVYQDTPCASGPGEKVNIQSNGAVNERAIPPGLRKNSSRYKEDDEGPQVNHQAVLDGMASGKPVVGMTENQLRIAMGSPTRVNTGDYGGRTRDQLIYERGGATYYVYVRDGVVASVQSSSGYRTSSGPQKRCLNSIEIRNMETTANSASITESQRRAMLRDIRDAKNCN